MTRAQARALVASLAALGIAAAIFVTGEDSAVVEREDDPSTWMCVIPNCYGNDHEFDDDRTPDCLRVTVDLEGNSVTRWFGCNVFPAGEAIGGECLPAPCGLEKLGRKRTTTMAGENRSRDGGFRDAGSSDGGRRDGGDGRARER